ncbi:MAG: hypothetical protein ABS62_00125 [Microbacterium sp. SCN 70-200]|mgnify:CR=1 FL=1|uniref:GreA/GreB family elongation factor n=1 Tax=unclassified Microbacterium TaxID=2609290 RepID=UPI00086DD27A|nr:MULTISPECIES: GreA/GreB family elongation factor [unclassified Microbacterium]MBN9215075.1 GreA/GreB family elongation factor [Microbacterium sp.]ODT42844.1 MAG: hypothetical protein ABS62_00125 [Microbacterium sp. SCN 70-200]OJV84849.1 MAG: hypothetical protein BGO46_05625 [Microbacterium sp. 70-16]
MADTIETVWMTQSALTALEAELAELNETPDASAARIAELRSLIRRADTGAKPDDGLIEPGMTVTARFADGSEETFLLGSRTAALESGDVELDVYSPDSPLGGAIAGHYVGETVSYTAPTGRAIEVTLVAAAPFA